MVTKTDSTRFAQDNLFRVMLSDLVTKNALWKHWESCDGNHRKRWWAILDSDQ